MNRILLCCIALALCASACAQNSPYAALEGRVAALESRKVASADPARPDHTYTPLTSDVESCAPGRHLERWVRGPGPSSMDDRMPPSEGYHPVPALDDVVAPSAHPDICVEDAPGSGPQTYMCKDTARPCSADNPPLLPAFNGPTLATGAGDNTGFIGGGASTVLPQDSLLYYNSSDDSVSIRVDDAALQKGTCDSLFLDGADSDCVMTVKVPYKQAACGLSRGDEGWKLVCSYPKAPAEVRSMTARRCAEESRIMVCDYTTLRDPYPDDGFHSGASGLGPPAPPAQEKWDYPAALESCTGVPNKNTVICRNSYGDVLCTGARQCSDASLYNTLPLHIFGDPSAEAKVCYDVDDVRVCGTSMWLEKRYPASTGAHYAALAPSVFCERELGHCWTPSEPLMCAREGHQWECKRLSEWASACRAEAAILKERLDCDAPPYAAPSGDGEVHGDGGAK